MIEHKSESQFRMPAVKRMILELVNDDRDPEFLIKRKEVLGVPVERQEVVFFYMRLMKEQVKEAFEAPDDYERDWRLFMARYYNAVLHAPFGPQFGSLPGVVPMAKDTKWDRALAFAQSHLANRMGVCKVCGRYYFKKYNPQTYSKQKSCSEKCRLENKNALNGKWYQESPNSPKNRFKQQLEKAGVQKEKIEKLVNGESVRFDD